MNIWECSYDGCPKQVTGCGGAVGIRAIGWYVRFGGGFGPVIYCPRHRPDQAPCTESPEAHACSLCAGEQEAGRLQEAIYTEADRYILQTISHR